jgi:lipid-binding SYLF domain-containing protein
LQIKRRIIMLKNLKAIVLGALVVGLLAVRPVPADAATAAEIDTRVKQALKQCFADVPGCKAVGEKAHGILIFPEITQAAVGIGGAYGEGALLIDGKTVGYYSLTAGSIGLQLGAQKFSQAMMFMTKEALAEFQASSGWEAGAGAGVTWIDQAASERATTISAEKPVVGFSFGEQGLMGAAAVGGAKITPITPDK